MRAKRLEQHLTQKQLANGICSQSMLSAIENGTYTPNATLLIRLCQRLDISLQEISLAVDYDISDDSNYNQTLVALCNQHRYAELREFLQQPATLDLIQNDEQTQAYYYYLAIALFNTQAQLSEVQKNLKLAIASDGITSLKRLSLVSLALVKVVHGEVKEIPQLISQATEKWQTLPYEENLNIIYYLVAMIHYKLGDYPTASRWINEGIAFVTSHNSHYMLANYYYLLAKVAHQSQVRDKEDVAQQRSQIFTELFAEKVYDDF
ncbi:helix-turn-helix transcriptional regulator [Ligilactobacillus equi]|uniref:helix-turn-helix transcriptional regulator n=1 Tax=Ligilactobacillus equi TaxID=137357 RepID=UPI001CDB23EB|nr:helix-turn-helix transcriptional regulator [Ligilactobacillus equi]